MKNQTLLLILLFLLTASLQAQKSFTRFDYSSITGSQDWKSLSRSERVERCNLDESTLKGMSEIDLLRALFDYPFLIDFIAFNDFEFGYNVLLSECKVLQELISRNEIESQILSFYTLLATEYCNVKSSDLVESNFSNVNLIIIEYILGRPEVLEKFSKQSKKGFFEVVANRRMDYIERFKRDGPESVSGISININASLLCGLSLAIEDISKGADEKIIRDLIESNRSGLITNKEVTTFIDKKIHSLSLQKQ